MPGKPVQVEYDTLSHTMRIYLPSHDVLEIDGFSSDMSTNHIKTLDSDSQRHLIRFLVRNL